MDNSEPPPPLHSPEVSASATSNPDRKGSSLTDWKDKIPAPAPESTSSNEMPKGRAFKGCGITVAAIIGLIVFVAWWREILLGAGLLGTWALVAFIGIRAKKSRWLSVGGGLVAGLVCFFILDAAIENPNITKSDLKNPPAALEKLTKLAIPNNDGFERITVEETGSNRDGYFLNVTYRSRDFGGFKDTYEYVKRTMDDAYRMILSHGELPVTSIKIKAQLQLKDSYGNVAWVDVYQTKLEEAQIGKLNRDNLKPVDFERIWDVVFINPVFQDFEGK